MSQLVKLGKKGKWIQCPQCLGHGEIPLSPLLSSVLAIICKNPDIDTISLGKKLDRTESVKHSALYNRLISLEKMGFVSRRHQGKGWLWKAIKP